MFTAQDPTSLKAAFAKLEDNRKYHSLYLAGVARQQSDQIFNLTLTRVASNHLRQKYGDPAIGIGRVKTPTLGIVCRRELEIRDFKPTDYFEIAMTVAGAAGKAKLLHAPSEDDRILDRARAEAIAAAAAKFRGPVSVETKRRNQAPPRPMDLPTLQKRAAKFGWTAKRTLATAQSLYETHKIITYPRAESRYLPENMIPDATPLMRALKAIPAYAPYPLAQPQIRTGKAGVFSDKALDGVSHHAIIPNINCPGSIAATAARLSGTTRSARECPLTSRKPSSSRRPSAKSP
jgi:DNA topoisomerase-3